jgi:aspartyl-tRNA(Asn)/glutamyl-tRNA(Gln) amidotransferase subunit A
VIGTILKRIERLEPRLNAMTYIGAERAMDAARHAETALMRGNAPGPLHGVPVTIKDLTWTKDFPTDFGSKAAKGFRAPIDAPMVTRLKDAGAIVVGKTTTSEFGWTGVSHCPLTGITHNPWKHGYNAGASSAGAGAAAAAGYGPLHQGSDGAGSIRMPSHFCGVFGLKPTFGRVPYYPVGSGDYTSHMGPMTRTVADSALMLQVMAGPHPLDHTTCEAGPADYLGRLHEGIRGRRIAYSPDLGVARVDPDVAALVKATVARFSELGATVEEVKTPWAAEGPEMVRFFWAAHMSRLQPHLAKWEAKMDPGLVACIKAASDYSVTDYQLMRDRKMAYIAAIHRWFEDWDFLLTPSVSVAAFPAELLMPQHWPQHDWDWLSWAEFSYPFNMSWNPAASVPCGFTGDGLPVGLQIVGRRFDDLGVLQASAAFEQIAPWADKQPKL